MPGAGDLVTVLSLEDFEFRTGMRDAAAQAKNFGKAVEDGAAKAQGALQRLNREAVGAIAGAGIGTLFKSLGEGQSARDAGIDALSSGLSALGGALHAVPMWQAQLAAFAADLGAQLVPALKESSKAAEEFGNAMAKMGTDFDRAIAKENASAAFARSVKKLSERGSVADVESAQDQNQARLEDLEYEIQARKQLFRQQMENARAAGGVEGPGGAGVYKIGPGGERVLQGPIPENAEVLPGVIGKAGAEEIMREQARIKELEDLLKRAQNRAEALNGAMANAEGREEIERRNKALAEQMKMQTDDVNEIERIRAANLTESEKKEEMRRHILDLQERNPMLAGQLDQALANLDKKEKTPWEGVGAVGFGSSQALSTVFAAMRAKEAAGDPAEKTNELLETSNENEEEFITKIEETKQAIENIGLGVGSL